MKLINYWLFNPLTRGAFNSKLNYSNLYNKRLLAMQMDLQYHIGVCIPILFVGLYLPKLILILYFHVGSFSNPGNLCLFDFLFIIISIINNKDFFKGQSVINRFLGYQIVEAETGIPADSVRCALRNCTGIIWPIEVIFLLIDPQRRLGDFIAGTKMIEVEKADPELIINDIKELKINLIFMKTLLITSLTSVVYIAIMFLLAPILFQHW